MKGTVLALIMCLIFLVLAGCTGDKPEGSVGDTGQNAVQGTTGNPTDPEMTDDPGETQPEGSAAATTPTEPNTHETIPSAGETPIDPAVPMTPQPGEDDSQELEIHATGKKRINYTVNISSVRYVTSPLALPDHPELAGYDDAWFRDHALVLVYETVASGTVEVDISRILVGDDTAEVELSHESKGGLGTADMTTWILWAEVDAGLAYTWSVENPAMDSNVTDH